MARSERIRGTNKVVEISEEVQERRLPWYDHVMERGGIICRLEDYAYRSRREMRSRRR